MRANRPIVPRKPAWLRRIGADRLRSSLLVARLCKPEVTGSIPVRSIKKSLEIEDVRWLCARKSGAGSPPLAALTHTSATGGRDERGRSAAEVPACRAGPVVLVAGKPRDDPASAGGRALEERAISAPRAQRRTLARDLHEGAVPLLLERDDDALVGVVRTHPSPGDQAVDPCPNLERRAGLIAPAGQRARARPPQFVAVGAVIGAEEEGAVDVGKCVRPGRATRV